jgi:hypothetical protein
MEKALEDDVRNEKAPLVAAGEGNLTAPAGREQQIDASHRVRNERRFRVRLAAGGRIE